MKHSLVLLLAFICSFPLARAQSLPEDRGIAGLRQALDRLDVVACVLHTGAHPDDENSSLLAWLSRVLTEIQMRPSRSVVTKLAGGTAIPSTSVTSGVSVPVVVISQTPPVEPRSASRKRP
jgi:hypothetical protein